MYVVYIISIELGILLKCINDYDFICLDETKNQCYIEYTFSGWLHRIF